MKMNKLTILMIAVVAIGVFALPSSLSVGAGQHKFTTVQSAGAVNAFCSQCHGGADAIASELALSNNSKVSLFGAKIHASQTCGSCHAITGGYATAINTGIDYQSEEHAAALPSCLKCHASKINTVGKELANATAEAHFNFKSATDDDIQCIACHTAVTKTGSITYSYNAGQTVSGLKIGN